jgi:hypothetical protein
LRSTEERLSNKHLEAVGFFETVNSDFGSIRFPSNPTWFSKRREPCKGQR